MSNQPKEPGHESFHRMNYLYQAAEATVKANVKGLDRQLLRNLWSLSKKTVKKLDPSLKRTLCKGCGGLLQPGTTARVRVKSKRQKHVAWTCLACGAIKRFNLDPKHKLWYDRPEAQVAEGFSWKKGKDKQQQKAKGQLRNTASLKGSEPKDESGVKAVMEIPGKAVDGNILCAEGDKISVGETRVNGSSDVDHVFEPVTVNNCAVGDGAISTVSGAVVES